MKIKTFIWLVLISSIFYHANAQSDFNVHRNLSEYMYRVRTEKYAPMPDRQLYSTPNANDLLNLLTTYYADSLAKVRLKACYLTYKAAKNVEDTILKQDAVMVLVFMLKDPDSGNVGSVASWLSEFTPDDFNPRARDSLVSALHNQVYYRDKIIKLTAFVGLKDQIEYIQTNLRNGVYQSGADKWAAHLALARMGVEYEINFCLEMVKRQGVNDDVVYELVPDLIYTRQKKTMDYVIELLHDKAKNCTSGNPEYGGEIMCGYRIMEFLAPVIKDFPLPVDSTGDLMVENYKKALKQLREWFLNRDNQYELITNVY